jgi:hypothetical protein
MASPFTPIADDAPIWTAKLHFKPDAPDDLLGDPIPISSIDTPSSIRRRKQLSKSLLPLSSVKTDYEECMEIAAIMEQEAALTTNMSTLTINTEPPKRKGKKIKAPQ